MVAGICKNCHESCETCFGDKKEMCKKCIKDYAKNHEK